MPIIRNPNRRGAPKGHKGGGGRPPEWFKRKCASIFEKRKLTEFWGAVAGGDPVEERTIVDSKGKPVRILEPASTKDRWAASVLLRDSAGWKPAEKVES